MHFYSITVALIYFVSINFDYRQVDGVNGVNALQRMGRNDETKVKCKEVVNEALRQYWDHSNEIESKETNEESDDKQTEDESRQQIDSNEKQDINKDSTEKESDREDKNSNSDKDLSESDESDERRSRVHIDDILRIYEIGSQEDTSEQNLILSIFRELKKLYESSVKPLEMIYKYRHITTRLITDAELFAKPKVLFLGAKSSGKTSLVNYLLGIDSTPMQLNTGLTTSYPHFTVLSYGDNYTRLSPTELCADFTFSSLQQFGQQFLEHYIQANRMPISLLQKMTIIDSPGLTDQISKSATMDQQEIDTEVYQWFIDRSDVIYIVIDVTQLQISHQLQALIEQLKGRDVRFILSKSELVSHSQIVTIIGQLLWILSPIMPSERPPQVYALTTVPQQVYDAFIDDQEVSWLKDLSNQISGISRVESRIAALRRHAVRVRNHAKLIDCYLSTFYKNKGIFTFGASSRLLATDITENPLKYRVYSGAVLGHSHNISRHDLPDPGVYREFFRSNPLIDFKPLTSTCSYFKGCPIDKLDITIAYQLPELVGKYKKLTRIEPYL
ncbi:unnamed protein product [Oppiella nova]|uniref:Sarcalumenin n=1 Tax=Oppiella nova TaxID=334625 RepID=A0A7R9L888_9ACAR|nr:unnamed protein product [Oppiella nova]CAG2159067.1 unnamed protein product [Oppiella nova]